MNFNVNLLPVPKISAYLYWINHRVSTTTSHKPQQQPKQFGLFSAKICEVTEEKLIERKLKEKKREASEEKFPERRIVSLVSVPIEKFVLIRGRKKLKKKSRNGYGSVLSQLRYVAI